MAEAVHTAALLALLAAGETRSQRLASALGLPRRTVQHRLARLRGRGLVTSGRRGAWRLTGAGQRAVLAAHIAEPTSSLDTLEALPAEHRALLRLIEDAVVARRALWSVYPGHWPAFVILGPTKSGKTLVGGTAARRFGLDPIEAVRLLMRETPGSLLGRRVQTGPDAWRTVPSPLLASPVIVVDEFDKASSELRQAAFAYVAGDAQYRTEDATLDVAATAILTLNAERDPSTLLPDAYLRRSVVLDTTPLREATADLDETARWLARAALPQVDPGLVPLSPELPEAARTLLRSILLTCLTARGWELVDVETIVRLALGRWALAPADPEAAVLSVAVDYLLVTATRPGLVEDDWPARFEAAAGGGVAPIADTLATARARHAAGLMQRASTAQATLDVSVALGGERERLRDALDQALRSAPRGRDLAAQERSTIAVARGKARPLREAIATARSLDVLEELEVHLEREILVPLRGASEVVQSRRQAAAQARQREAEVRRQAVERKKTELAAEQADRRAARARHAELQALYRRSVNGPGEDVIGRLIAAGCLTERSEQYEAETLGSIIAGSIVGRGIRSLLGSASPPPVPEPPASRWGLGPPLRQPSAPVPSGPQRRYVTRTRTWYEDRADRHVDAGDLFAWGNAPVRAILEVTAVAERLPRLSLAARRRREPASRASTSSSRRP